MGKTGQLTPVAVFDPVEIDGTIVERASLHNISIMEDLELSYGDTITVYKANMIIPQVKDNLDRSFSNICTPPWKCPICCHDTKIVKENDTEVLICTNDRCKGKLLGIISHAVSKNALNIDGLSEATIEKFIDLGWVTSIKDIYHLNEYKYDIVQLNGFGGTSVKKLLESIEKSRNTTLDRFIYSLSIPLIGRSASKTISKYFNGDVNKFIEAWKCGYGFSWNKLDDFGASMHNSMAKFYLDNYSDINLLLNEFTFEETSDSNISDKLKGKIFAITGTLNQFSNRDEAKNKIESLGGKVSGSISAKTSYLVNNDINSTSSKNKKAKQLNIPIITESELLNML
ncbi:MAG: BRCT domain-containing protein [Blautia caecimuris]